MSKSTIAIAVLVLFACVVTSQITQMVVAAPKPQEASRNVELPVEKIMQTGIGLQFTRFKVPGGWLLALEDPRFSSEPQVGLTFVPDEDHSWEGGPVK